MTGLNRGDAVLVWFPNSDLVTFQTPPGARRGGGQSQYRCPASCRFDDHEQSHTRGHPSRVFIPLNSPEAKEAGFRTDSVVLTDNLATVLDKAIAAKLGRLINMAGVDAALRRTLGL